jgi:hypothetical protein
MFEGLRARACVSAVLCRLRLARRDEKIRQSGGRAGRRKKKTKWKRMKMKGNEI